MEAARVAGAATILSEGLGDGQRFDGLRVVNPFKGLGAIEPPAQD